MISCSKPICSIHRTFKNQDKFLSHFFHFTSDHRWNKSSLAVSVCWESEDSHLLIKNGYFYTNCHHSWVFKILRSCFKAYTSSKTGSYRYRGWFALGFIVEHFNFFASFCLACHIIQREHQSSCYNSTHRIMNAKLATRARKKQVVLFLQGIIWYQIQNFYTIVTAFTILNAPNSY